MTFADLDTIVADLGPEWTWLVRRAAPCENKPGEYLANVQYRVGEFANGPGNQFFPVWAPTAAEAFSESFRRAYLWNETAVK